MRISSGPVAFIAMEKIMGVLPVFSAVIEEFVSVRAKSLVLFLLA
jgi:hypothetical protein